MKGRGMCLSTHGTIGGVIAEGAIDDAAGLRADEAPLVIAVASAPSTSCPPVASASVVSGTSKRGAEEVGCSSSTQTKGI